MKGHARDVNCPEERKAGEKRIRVQVFPSVNSETLHVFPQSPAHTVVCRHMCAHTHVRAHTQAPWGCQQSRSLLGLLTLLSRCRRTLSSPEFGTQTHTRAVAPATASPSTCGAKPQLLGRKLMTKLDSILKSREITLPAKVCVIKSMVFLVVMYGCESWTIKKAER